MRRSGLVALSLAACSFEGSGLGSASSLGETTARATGSGEAEADADTQGDSGFGSSGDGDPSGAEGSSSSTASADTTESGATEAGATGSSGAGSGESSSTGPAPVCGNGIVEPPEPCDGGIVAVTCGDVDAGTMGKPNCEPDCTLDLEPCCDVAGTSCPVIGDDCCGSCVLKDFQLVCQ